MNQTKALTLKEQVNAVTTALDSRAPEFAAALGVNPERFLRIVHTAVANNTKLAQCDPASIIGAAMEAAQCGLNVDPVLGEGALVPFQGKAKFIPGYRGLAKLAIESEYVLLVDSDVVHEKDSFNYRKGSEEVLEHVPYLGDADPGKTIAAYAKVVMRGNIARFVVMPRRRIEEIRKRAPSGSSESSAWSSDYDEMAKKTVVKNALKLTPLSPKAERALGLLEFPEYETPAPPEKDITPREQRRAGKQESKPKPEPETKPEEPKAQPEKKASDEPPPPGDEDAPPAAKPAPAPEPAKPAAEGEIMITKEEAKKLQTILRNKPGDDPKTLLEGIVGHDLANISALTHTEFLTIMQSIAPEELDDGQGGFFD